MFKTCNSRTCVDSLACQKCNHLVPSFCGGRGVPKMVDAPCNGITFTGITDVTLPQFSDGIDLAEGVHAYDGNGNEISFRYSPSSVDTSELGEHTVTYTASGVADHFTPHMCGDMALYMSECDYGTARAYRTITIEPIIGEVCKGRVCQALVGCVEYPYMVVCETNICQSLAGCAES